ncbi:MAG: hypothetical protein ACKOA1_01550 [Bacteroidota bacterium]
MTHRFICFLLLFTLFTIQSPATDNTYFNAPADFKNRIRPLSAILYNSVPDSSAISTTCKQYMLFHDASVGWILAGSGSGQVWTLDSSDHWVRQDSTEVFGYSFGAQILPGPMKYGGNGLWKSNGLLLIYSWDAHEWEAVLLSREIHCGYTDNCFYDKNDSTLIQLGMSYSNAGLKDFGYSTDSIYKLKLSTREWSVLGRFSKEFNDCFTRFSRSWPSPSGFLFRTSRGHDAILIDLHRMTFRYLKENVVIRLASFDRTMYLRDRVSFTTDYGIYTMNPHNYELLDSISWKEINDACGPEKPIMQSASKYSGWTVYLLLSGIGFTTAIAYWFRWRRKNSRDISEFIDQSVLEVVDEPTLENASLLEVNNGSWYIDGQPIIGLMSIESRLLEVLVEKRKHQQPMTTQQFNDILGISDRSLDSQKKTRSESIRNINKRFNQSGYRGEAVRRTRQEDDRRAVTYTIALDIRIE